MRDKSQALQIEGGRELNCDGGWYLVVLLDELYDVTGIASQLAGHRAWYDLTQVTVTRRLGSRHREYHVHSIVGHLRGELADAGVVLSLCVGVLSVAIHVTEAVIRLQYSTNLQQ